MFARAATLIICITLAACSAQQSAAPPAPDEVLFTGTLQELTPHHSGDHFIYRATTNDRASSLQVEHISALDAPGEFTVSTTEDGSAISKLHMRIVDSEALLLSEGLERDGMVLVYEPPLHSFTVPLTTSTQHTTSPVTLMRVSDGKVVAHGEIEQTVAARRAAADADGAFVIYTDRMLQLPNRAWHLSAKTWIKPGIGEVRSEGAINGADVIRRSLLCAIVAGQRVGEHCDHLAADSLEK